MKRVRHGLVVAFVGASMAVAVLVIFARSGSQPRASEPQYADFSRDGVLPTGDRMEFLARQDPIAFLQNCLRRYDREVAGYTATLEKREVDDGGKLRDREVILARFRERPYSLYLEWASGAGQAARVLYVEGQNENNLLAWPQSVLAQRFLGVVRRPIGSKDGQELKRFGLKRNSERTLACLEKARAEGTLDVEYLGERTLEQLGGRPCFALHWHTDRPQEKGVTDLTIYVEKETWLQTGSVLRGRGGDLVGEYYFRDVRLNPEFKQDQFTPAAVQG